MCLIGVAEVVLGRFMKLSKKTKALPFITAAILGLLALIDGSLGLAMQVIGSLTCIVSAVVAAVLFVINVGNPNQTFEATS